MDAIPFWWALILGLGMAVWGAAEYRVAYGTSADATAVDLAALEKGQDPPQNHLRIGPHVRLYPGSIYVYKEKDQSLADPPIDLVIYPILSRSSPFVEILLGRPGQEDDPRRVVDMRLPTAEQLRVLVLSRKYRKASEIPTSVEFREDITGLLINPIRRLEKKETDLLRQSYPDIDFAKTLILEEDRKPKSLLVASLIAGGGGLLLVLVALRLLRRVCVVTTP